MPKKKILVLSNSGKYLFSHRQSLINSLSKQYDILISATDANKYFKKKKISKYYMNRGYSGLISEIRCLFAIIKEIKSFKPDILMPVSLKTCIFIIFLNFFFRIKSLYLITGLGFIFSNYSKYILKLIVRYVIKLSNNKYNYFLFQNKSDQNYFQKNIINIKKRSFIIEGTGIKRNSTKIKKIKKTKTIILPSRILYDKGINDFVEISQLVAAKFKNVSFHLIGSLDTINPTAISKKNLFNMLKNKNSVKWIGYKRNMRKYYKSAHLVCFPSYHEGSPRALIEAISFGLPIVCYNISGNRAIVKNKINGYRVKLYNYKELANKILIILNNEKIYKKMSQESLNLTRKFYNKVINEKYHKVLKKLINNEN